MKGGNMPEQKASNITAELIHGEIKRAEFGLKPFGAADSGDVAPRSENLPGSLDDLPVAVTRAYDLTITTAVDLKIPVIGSVSGGYSRRVVVMERAAYKEIEEENERRQYGYAIRLCVTVNNWSAGTKVSLPFLAASAELGRIEGQWLLQVIGLSGQKIDAAILPPSKLDVKTFVIAQQSLEKVIKAVRDRGTIFQASLIAVIEPLDEASRKLRCSAGRTYALSCIERGRNLEDAQKRLDVGNPELNDCLTEVYETFAGLTNPMEKPSDEVRRHARELLGPIRADA
jgi:hypothetical protein